MSAPSAFRPLVVLWGFPELSQTFIHRELREWLREHPGLRILAGKRVEQEDIAPDVQAWKAERTRYLPAPWIWAPRGLLRGLARPGFLATLWWMARLPHRTLSHRLRGLAMCLAAADVAAAVRIEGADYVHAHFGSYNTEWAMALSRLAGIPYGGSWHAVDIWKDANMLGEKIRHARLVLTCTRFNHAHLTALAPQGHAGKVRLAYHGVDMARLGEAAYPGESRILAIGRLVEKKGFHDLIAACAMLLAEGREFSLDLIGEGPERARLEALSARLGLGARIAFLGARPNPAVLDALRASALLAMPSVRMADGNIDGIPNVILEAMALGRPVVGSDFSGIPEVVIHGETGLLFPPGDVVALAAALRALLDDPAAARAMGERAAAYVRARFDARANARLQLDMIEEAAR